MISNVVIAVVAWAGVLVLVAWDSRGPSRRGDHWDTEERHHYGRERLYWMYVTLITLIAAIGASLSAWFAWGAVQASREQVQIARDAETHQFRAYVAMTGISMVAQVNNVGRLSWSANPIWRNSGLTPAIHLTVSSYTFSRYRNGPSASNYETSTFTLGPGDRSEILFAGGQLSEPSRQYYVEARGVAVYQDVFGHWRVNVSCRRTIMLDSVPNLTSATGGTKMIPDTVPCNEWNCFDEECASYRAAIENMPSDFLPLVDGDGITAPKVPLSAYSP
jgi:hypothetical protein